MQKGGPGNGFPSRSTREIALKLHLQFLGVLEMQKFRHFPEDGGYSFLFKIKKGYAKNMRETSII